MASSNKQNGDANETEITYYQLTNTNQMLRFFSTHTRYKRTQFRIFEYAGFWRYTNCYCLLHSAMLWNYIFKFQFVSPNVRRLQYTFLLPVHILPIPMRK